MDKLKPCITDDDIDLSKRFEDHRTVNNVANFLMFTNYQDALAIREDGRRYFVLQSPIQRPSDVKAMGGQDHFNRLYRMIRDNPGGLRAWFEMWKISPDFEPEGRAPVTPYLHEFADNAASPLSVAVKEAIADEAHPLVRRDLLSLSCLRGCMDSAHLAEFSDQALGGVLRELGWIRYGRVIVNSNRHQLWVKDMVEDPRGAAEARERYL
jgi:hypothetical protein